MDFSEGSSVSSSSGVRRSDAPRPVSRRGYRDTSKETPAYSAVSRSGSMRPTSAYRGGTASRLSTGFGPAPPTTSRQPTAITGFSMIDRPITQQGLSGLRTGTARGFRTRQTQDKRYWEELMQVKTREMKAEIARLSEQAEAGEREKSAKKHYEKRVRELAQELTDLQGRLADYNTTLRIVNGEATKQNVVEQTRELVESNQKLQEEVEQVFLEKQRKEMQLTQLREQADKEQSAISKLLFEMTPEQKELYQELEAKASSLRNEAEEMRSHTDQLSKEKEAVGREISGSQVKVHLLELNRRLLEAEEKRDTLKNELNNKLDPQQERERLLVQVREDNAAISSLDSNAASLKEQIKKVQELIEQAEEDLEEGNSERHQKYRDLKKREEAMDAFLSTYEGNLAEEQLKIQQLENDIVFALEHTSSNINLDLSEIDLLKQKSGSYSMIDDSKKTVESLTSEYERLLSNLKKAEATRERLGTELQTLPERTFAMRDELVTLSDIDKLREDGAEQKKAIESEIQVIKEKLVPTQNAVIEAASKLEKLQESLEGNEMYNKLNKLEEQVASLESTKAILEEDIASITLKADYEPIKRMAMGELAKLNSKIIEDLNTTKAY